MANLQALRRYRPGAHSRQEDLESVLFRTRPAGAVSEAVYNPDYLIKVQQAKGSMSPFLEGWETILPRLKTVLIDGENHFDLLNKKTSVQFIADFISQNMGIETTVKPGNIRGLSLPIKSNPRSHNLPRDRKVAIIGMSGRFPGGENLDAFWRLLKNGASALTEFPRNRDWIPNRIYSQTQLPHGGFIEDIDCFDPLFFQISPKEADRMDPSERLFLQESWKAIEDAGTDPGSLSGKRWGVYCGGGGDYTLRL